MSTFDSTKTSLRDLLRDITTGKTQLPDFQRGWVWDDEHILSLLVSIARSFPVGAVMLLENGGETHFKMRPVEGVDPSNVAQAKIEKLILDGQQRLTSLTQVLMFNKPVKTRDQKKRPMERLYYIDIVKALEGPTSLQDAFFGVDADKTVRSNFGRKIDIDLRTPELEYERFCFPCHRILDWTEWLQGLSAHFPQKLSDFLRFQKEVIGAFDSYQLPVISLSKNTSKEAVCLVFEKVNTGGVPLSVFELITAVYAADGVNLRDEWFGSKKDNVTGTHTILARQKMLASIEPTEFFQGLSLLHTYALRQKDLAEGKVGKQATGVSAKRESVLSLPLSAYQEWKHLLMDGFVKAAKFLRKEAFFNQRDLPYRTQLVPLGAILALLGDRWLEQRIYDKLARWYWCGVLGELYGGAVETRIALDLQEFMAWLDQDEELPATVRDAHFQPARLDTLRSRNSAAYKGISTLIQRNGAKDWFWKSTIRELDENDWEESKLDVHHIFPKDWCEKRGIEPRRYNSILNKTPISFKANRMIGGKSPSDYLAQLQGHKSVLLNDAVMDELLQTHLLDTTKLRADDFPGFIDSRRELILGLISNVMGKAPDVVDEVVEDDDLDEDDLPLAVQSGEPDDAEVMDDIEDDEDSGNESDDGKTARIEQVKALLLPEMERLASQFGFKYRLAKHQRAVIVQLPNYRLRIGARNKNLFTFYASSKTRSAEQALMDFPGTVKPEYRVDKPERDRSKRATMKMAAVDQIAHSIQHYLETAV